MKKNILALAVATAMTAPIVMAEEVKVDAPKVYGQVNVAISSVTDLGMKTYDRDSRLGVKGSQDLGNGLKGVYQMEFGTKVGDALGTISGRNAVVGLEGSFGTVLVGRHDTPFKMSQPKDLFGDATNGDMAKDAMAGNLGRGSAGEDRVDNMLAYMSPEFGGVKLIVAGVSNLAKDDAATPLEDESKTDDSLTNAISTSITYGSTKKGIYAAVAYNTFAAETNTNQKAYTEMRVSAQYAEAGLIANVVYQTFDDGASTDAATEGSNIQIGAAYKMGNLMPKLKYSMVDRASKLAEDGTTMAFGVDYSIGKKTTAYVEYVSADKKMMGNADGLTDVSVGIVHKF